jgi:hypothetical protein
LFLWGKNQGGFCFSHEALQEGLKTRPLKGLGRWSIKLTQTGGYLWTIKQDSP